MISVIVPVYNVERYLRECLDSLISQAYKDLQIILIDDGSTDSSGEICEEYAEKDERITLIHQKNRGAGAAKNTGLRLAKGEYLAFVDGDDYLNIDAYRYMMELMREYNADVVQCNFQKIFLSKEEIHHKDYRRKEMMAHDYTRLFLKDWTCGLLWDKLFRRRLFNGIFFEEGNIVDDDFFTYRGILNASLVICDDKVVYNYRQRKSSVSFLPENIERKTIYDRLNYLGIRKKIVASRFPDLADEFEAHYGNTLLWMTKESCLTPKSLKFLKTKIKEHLTESRQTIKIKKKIRLYQVLMTSNKALLKNKTVPQGQSCLGDFFD